MKNNVVDKNGVSYTVIKNLGEGSQGQTFLLEGGKYIVKLYKHVVNTTELKSKINFLRNLDMDKRYYSVPMKEIVSPKCGYISEFASGMMPLLGLIKQEGTFEQWFESTGGTLKRYGVLIKLASAIRTLHSKGLVYCDLSPNNVYVSEKPSKCNVFMIDMDNLRYKTSIIHNIYTRYYGAPEVVKEIAPNTPMSDCYSFAVIAYKLLTFTHPLIGDKVSDGELELEEQALRGGLPWVEDPKDGSNSRSTGLPSSFFVAESIMNLFHRTFEEGLNNPMKRPSMGEWFDALNEALNDLLMCKSCRIHYPFSNKGHCPLCEEKPDQPLTLTIQRWEKEEYYDKETNSIRFRFDLQPLVLERIIIDANTPKYIKAFHFVADLRSYDRHIAKIEISHSEQEKDINLIIYPEFTLFYKKLIPGSIFEKNSSKNVQISYTRNTDHKMMIIGIKDFTTPQRVIVIR